MQSTQQSIHVFKLSLDIGKTNYIVFSCKNNKTIDEEYRVQIDNVNIQRVNTTQFVGIHIVSKLHVTNIKIM